VKTSFQLSIDTAMKQRLLNFTNQTGIPVARLVRDMLKKYLPEEERKHNIQLPLDRETDLYKGKKDKNRQK
jgi:predicted DNA-binding protein